MESLAARIKNDLVQVLEPLAMNVTVESSPRGGLSLKANSLYWRNEDENLSSNPTKKLG
jgi:NADPH-dependent 7-cyano-7-deazaguanine reductase QueF